MRKLIFGINLTADGCCDHTRGTGGDEIHEYFTQLLRDAGVLVYGRKTYELMVPYWPDVAKGNYGQTKAINDFAHAFDAVEKIIVFSQSLERADGKNTSIVRSGLRDEVIKLKLEQGKNILLGGVNLSSQLIALGLVDEYHFVIHPAIAGDGRRLMEGVNLPVNLQLKLAGSKVFKSGCIALRYEKQ